MSIHQISTEYIAIDPDCCYGKPRIVETRITVAAIAEMYLQMGQSLEEIAVKYDLSLAAVHGAMAYYYDHREEIDGRVCRPKERASLTVTVWKLRKLLQK